MTTPRHQVWFITGATSGIGRELVRQALDAGESVAALARNTDALDEWRTTDRLLSISCDVADEASVREAVERTVSRFGRIDVVANNAGYGLFGAVEEATDAQARAIFDTNVFGVLNVLRATLPVLRAQRSGHILQGSSTYGQMSHPGVGLLSASKYAVEGLTDALVAEVAPLGITVTLIQPGYVATPFLAKLDIASSTYADYDSTVREVYKSVGALPPTAFVSPAAVAAGIRTAAASDSPPLRLALGSAGADGMRNALTARINDLDATTTITKAVDNPAA